MIYNKDIVLNTTDNYQSPQSQKLSKTISLNKEVKEIIEKINQLQAKAEAIPFIDENEAWKNNDQVALKQVQKDRDARFSISQEQRELKEQLWNIKIEAWKINGDCEVCETDYNENSENFEFYGSLAIDSKIKGRCQNCKDKIFCDTCRKWVNNKGYIQLKGGLFSSFFKLIDFCDKDCKKQAKKLAKMEIANYNQQNAQELAEL